MGCPGLRGGGGISVGGGGGGVVVVVGAAHCTGFFSIIFNTYISSTINYNDTINHDELLS